MAFVSPASRAAALFVAFVGSALAASPEELSPQAAFARGVALDADRGQQSPLPYYRRAAEAELAPGQFNVAVLLDAGRVVPRDAGGASLWYAAAAAHGDGRAAFDLGQLYDNGDGIARNRLAARAWFERAVTLHVPAAARRILPLSTLLAQADAGAALAASQPLRPRDLAMAPVSREVALIWAAPSQGRDAVPVQVFVQLVSHQEGASLPAQHTVFTGYVKESATLVTLPAGHGDYAWRTLTVSPASGRYVASDWAHFTADIPRARFFPAAKR